MSTPTPLDDQLRDLMRRAVDQAPPAPTFDDALLRAERQGVRSGQLYVATEPQRHRDRRRSLRTLLAALVATLGIGGGGYLAYANLVGPDGYDTPTEASVAFVDALSSGDLLRASRALAPFERDHMDVRLRNVLALFTDSRTLNDNDLSRARHISLRPDGLQWRERPMADGFSRVEVTAGHLWLTYDEQLAGEALHDTAGSGRLDLVDALRPYDGNDHRGPAAFVTTRTDGAWYVSLSYSVLDAAVGPARDRVVLNTPVSAPGATSPEAAASQAYETLYGAGMTLADPRLREVIDPVSGEAFHRYLGLQADDGAAGTASLRSSRWRITGTGQWRTATLTSYEYRNDSEDPNAWQRATEADCPDAAADAPRSDSCGLTGAVTVALVERDGRWYVDPIESAGRLLSWTLRGRAATAVTGPVSPSGAPDEIGTISIEDAERVPPEAVRGPDGHWTLTIGPGWTPSDELLELLRPCTTQRATWPEPDAGVSVPATGPGFPPGFWWCMATLDASWGYASSGGAAPGTGPVPTTVPN